MTEKEMIQKNIEEFSRLQDYMLAAEKDSPVYRLMKIRYFDLKAILTCAASRMCCSSCRSR